MAESQAPQQAAAAPAAPALAPAAQQQQRSLETIAEHTAQTLVAIRDHLQTDVDRMVAANVGYAERLDTLNTGLLEISGALERIEEEAHAQSNVLVHLLVRNVEIEQALGDPANLSRAIGQSVNRALRDVIDPIREIYEGEIARKRVERAAESLAAGLAREGLAFAAFFRDSLWRSLRMIVYWILLFAFCILWMYPYVVWKSATDRVTQDYIYNLQNVLVRNPDWRNMLNS
ncbi:hypothetical protein LZ554_007819 [Drepanopeziza brunnea f. sp. 'monogermtubi']|nr:hypothetical protein LZ554_007819 [Drepanopeziza brunnea f. sp. 'monogermtubi']